MTAAQREAIRRKTAYLKPDIIKRLVDALGGEAAAAAIAGVQAQRVRAYLVDGRLPLIRLRRLMAAYRRLRHGDVF